MHLAVIGCHRPAKADVCRQERTCTNVYGRPQTVLKTAALPSIGVHGGPLEFDRTLSDSRIVRSCPLVSVELAVFLAVRDRMHRGSKSQGSEFDSCASTIVVEAADAPRSPTFQPLPLPNDPCPVRETKQALDRDGTPRPWDALR